MIDTSKIFVGEYHQQGPVRSIDQHALCNSLGQFGILQCRADAYLTLHLGQPLTRDRNRTRILPVDAVVAEVTAGAPKDFTSRLIFLSDF
jgi:hypothetical protein